MRSDFEPKHLQKQTHLLAKQKEVMEAQLVAQQEKEKKRHQSDGVFLALVRWLKRVFG